MNQLHRLFSTLSPAAYAEVSIVARRIGEAMVSRLDLVTLDPKVILDVGSGTGYCAELLRLRYPEARVIALDNEEKMLRFGQGSSFDNLICADTLSLPLQKHSVDLIFSNILLPWCSDWDAVFREWRRVLRPEGLLVFSCFGLDTLKELPENIVCLKDMHELGDTLVHAKFSDPVMDMEYLTLTYRERERLFYELQMNGMIASESVFEIEKNKENLYSTTYEIIYGHTWGPNENVDFTADEEGTVKIPLSFLRNRGVKL